MKYKKKLLIIAATHGDEKIGVEAINALNKKGYSKYFDCLIGNPKALKLKRRFVDFDLNRAYPGIKESLIYEKSLAYENLMKVKKYKYIIDIHEASSGKDNFIIVPKQRLPKSFPIQFINLKKVLLWPDPKGPLSQMCENAIELEFGMNDKNRIKITDEAVQILEKFIRCMQTKNNLLIPNESKECFYVYDKITLNENSDLDFRRFRDFRLEKVGTEKFYPLLTGQYLKDGIICYKMKRVHRY